MKTWVYIVIALVAGGAGFAIYQHAIEPRLASRAEPAISQDAPPPAPESSAAASGPQESGGMPEMLPEFTLADLNGEPRSIRSWPGKSMIVNFWATWCAPCRREIPLLRQIQDEHGDEGFQLVGVAVDIREDVVKYAEDIGIDYPVLIGEQDGLEAVSKFGLGSLGFPFTVFTDDQHRIVLFHLGELKEAEAEALLDVIRRVNSGELTPEAARTVASQALAAA